MYIRKTNNKTHKKYSIEEKNQIVLLYLDRHMGREELIQRCRMLEDIKKSMAYLVNQKQKKNIK